MVLTVESKEHFEKQLKDAGNKLVVVDFYAVWCGPCKMIAPRLETLSKEEPNVVFLKVDVDQTEDLAMEYDISAMPTFVFIKNGQKVHSFAGANYDKVVETVNAHK